tara:strand:+ start:1356 stop:1958 length:603 start_codon:yes stop_codon:yes gene_type:complete
VKQILRKWRKFTSNLPKTLLIFDFDDTLVTTRSKVRSKITGKSMDSQEWDDFIRQNPDFNVDDYDFSDFTVVVEPEPIEKTINLMISALNRGKSDSKVVILTARHDWEPVRDYFVRTLGVDIKVVAINGPHYSHIEGSDAEKKAKWIENQINKGYDEIKFWDNSVENVNAAKKLANKHPDVKIDVFLVKNGEKTTFKEME